MPWYAWLYVLCLAALTCLAAFDDLKIHVRVWRIVIDLIVGALEVVFVIAWYFGVPRRLNSALLPALVVFAVLWFVYGAFHAARTQDEWMRTDGTPAERLIWFTAGSLVAVISILPALTAGIVLSWRLIAR